MTDKLKDTVAVCAECGKVGFDNQTCNHKTTGMLFCYGGGRSLWLCCCCVRTDGVLAKYEYAPKETAEKV